MTSTSNSIPASNKETPIVQSTHPLEPADIKIILLGDSAVGKSKLMERFLLDDYIPHQSSTYALTLYRYEHKTVQKPVQVDFWDTAGQEQFQSMHPSYYHNAHCCILVFDITRKITYKNLQTWYDELVSHRGIQVFRIHFRCLLFV
jgi:small GTP-binding protein